MRKPLVVVIEPDEDYLAPLEMKLAFAADEKVNFEFITSKEIYQKYFGTLRNIDILVINEHLYTDEINKHNIERIYILTEETESLEKDTRSSVIRLFKYSNLNALVGMILPDAWLNENAGTVKGQVIVVCSPSGGAGCTTVSMGIAGFLANKQRKVFYMNTQPIQNFQYFLDDKECLPVKVATRMNQSGELYHGLKSYMKKEGFDYMPQLPSTRNNLNIDMQIYDQLVTQISDSQEYDFIIVDIGSDLNLGEWNMFERADKVLVITDQNEYSAFKIKCLQQFISLNDQDKFILVCNRFEANKEDSRNMFRTSTENKVRVKEYIEKVQQPIVIKQLSNIKGIQRLGMLMF